MLERNETSERIIAGKSGFRNLWISLDIPHLYHGYTSIDIPCISMYIHGYTWYIYDGYTWISMYIPRISTPLDIPGISMDIHGYPRDIDQDCIYMGYTWNIPCIYMKSGFQMEAAFGEPSLICSWPSVSCCCNECAAFECAARPQGAGGPALAGCRRAGRAQAGTKQLHIVCAQT